MNIIYNIKKYLKNIYSWFGFPFAPEGTLPYYIHTNLKKIIKKELNKKQYKKNYTVAFWSGIGDSLWALVVLPALMQKHNLQYVDLVVHKERKDIRNGRSLSYLKRFPYFSKITSEYFNIRKFPEIDSKGYPTYIDTGSSSALFDYSLIVNTYLEHGKNFNEIASILNLNESNLNFFPFKDYKWELNDFNEVFKILNVSEKGYCIFYTCSLNDNTISGLNKGGLWKVKDWIDLGKMIYNESGMKIVLVGAVYDLDYIKNIQQESPDIFHQIFINNCGTLELTETLGLLKYAQCVIGLPSGIPISSVYLRTKTAMFWRPKELSMNDAYENYGFHPDFATDWVPQDMLTNGDYIYFWYGKDNASSVFDKILSNGWLKNNKTIFDIKKDINRLISNTNT